MKEMKLCGYIFLMVCSLVPPALLSPTVASIPLVRSYVGRQNTWILVDRLCNIVVLRFRRKRRHQNRARHEHCRSRVPIVCSSCRRSFSRFIWQNNLSDNKCGGFLARRHSGGEMSRRGQRQPARSRSHTDSGASFAYSRKRFLNRIGLLREIDYRP